MIATKISKGFSTDMNTTALEFIQAAFPDVPCTANLDAVVLTVQPEQLETTLSRLKNDPELQYGLLLDVTAVDYLEYPVEQATRFAVVHTLRNWEKNQLVQVVELIKENTWQSLKRTKRQRRLCLKVVYTLKKLFQTFSHILEDVLTMMRYCVKRVLLVIAYLYCWMMMRLLRL